MFEIKEKKRKKKFVYGKGNLVTKGTELCVISLSYSTLQCLKVYNQIKKNHKKEISVFDLLSVNPLDKEQILNVAKKHKKILILDIDHSMNGLAREIYRIIKQKYKD